MWRLRRIPAFEAALMDWLGKDNNGRRSGKLRLGRTVWSFLKMDFSGKLSRYETSLQRQLSALLSDLQDMQRRREGSHEAEARHAIPAGGVAGNSGLSRPQRPVRSGRSRQ